MDASYNPKITGRRQKFQIVCVGGRQITMFLDLYILFGNIKKLKYLFVTPSTLTIGCTKSFFLNLDLSKVYVKLPRAYFGSPPWLECLVIV